MFPSLQRRATQGSPAATPNRSALLGGWLSRPTRRHLLTILLSVLLVLLFGAVHENWSPMHRWNKATADASLVLLTMTMAVGPAARLWPASRRLIPMRREFGIHAIVLALVHTVIILEGWVVWDLRALVGFAFHPDFGTYVMVQHGFGLANLIGVAALAYGLVLMATSSDRAVRFLGASAWKFVQSGAYVLWALVVVHTAYFLFMHFLDFHRPLPDPNPLRWPFVGLVMLVLGLRLGASVQVWRNKRSVPQGSQTRAGEAVTPRMEA